MSLTNKDIYIRKDGLILYDVQAINERKRAIAQRKALDIHKLLQSYKCRLSRLNQNPFNSSIILKDGKTARRHLSCSNNTVLLSHNESPKSTGDDKSSNSEKASNPSLNSHSTSSQANVLEIEPHSESTNEQKTHSSRISTEVLTANAEDSTADAQVSCSKGSVNALNTQVTGANVSTHATADGIIVSCNNTKVTGIDISASASVSAAKVQVGNVDLNGGNVGAKVAANGVGINCGNVTISGPSVAASATVDGSLFFGNINVGLQPSFDIGFGFDVGIPFLSGGSIGNYGNGSEGNNDANTGEVRNNDKKSKKPNGNVRQGSGQSQKFSSSTFSNNRQLQSTNNNTRKSKSSEVIDPVVGNALDKKTVAENDRAKSAIGNNDKQIVGSHGCSKPNAAISNDVGIGTPQETISNTNPSPNGIRHEINVSSNPNTETPSNKQASTYSPKIVSRRPKGMQEVGTTQMSSNPDLAISEKTVSPNVRDSVDLKLPPIRGGSACKSTPKNDAENLHRTKLGCSRVVSEHLPGEQTGKDSSFSSKTQKFSSSTVPNDRQHLQSANNNTRNKANSQTIGPVAENEPDKKIGTENDHAKSAVGNVSKQIVGSHGCSKPSAVILNDAGINTPQETIANINPSSNGIRHEINVSSNPNTETPSNKEESAYTPKIVSRRPKGMQKVGTTQMSSNPDLAISEKTVSPNVRDSVDLKLPPIRGGSARKSTLKDDAEKLHRTVLDYSSVFPDRILGERTNEDSLSCGNGKQLPHVFNGRTWPAQSFVVSNESEISEDDKLLLEECKKLGHDDLTLSELNYWKKKLKSDEEYEREVESSHGSPINRINTNNHSKNKDTSAIDNRQAQTESSEPCKDHSKNVRCMKCMNGTSRSKIQHISGNIHGFKFNN